MTGRRTWRASASAGLSPRSLRSTTRTRSRRSPSQGRGPSLQARSTTTCLTMTRRRWTGCSRARCPTGLIALPWRSSPPVARRSSAMIPPPRARPPSVSGTARRARSPPCRWLTRWAWCSQARLQATLARVPARACDPGAGRARSPRPVLPCRQRRGARARDPRCSAARARTGRDGDPRCGRRSGRIGDARALANPARRNRRGRAAVLLAPQDSGAFLSPCPAQGSLGI
jgi:hypothetical protein